MIKWRPEERPRGLRADEVVLFSSGSYSDYRVDRVVMTTRAISADEMDRVCAELPLRVAGHYHHYETNDLINALIQSGAMKEVAAVEICVERDSPPVGRGPPAAHFEFDMREYSP